MKMPGNTRAVIDNYVDYGHEPTPFVRAVLANDLIGAFELADDKQKAVLGFITSYVRFNVPGVARGSYDLVAAWVKSGGIKNKR